jgi:hypothetical protein
LFGSGKISKDMKKTRQNHRDRLRYLGQLSFLNCSDFELKLRFFDKYEFKGGWVLKDFVLSKETTPVYKHGNLVLQDGLQTLRFDLGDMLIPSRKMEQDMEFESEIS